MRFQRSRRNIGMDAAMSLLARMYSQANHARAINRENRQQRYTRNRSTWHTSGSGPRERARRIRQMANFMDCGQYNFSTTTKGE